MSYKPEKIGRHRLTKGAAKRARRDAKKAATRSMRAAVRLDVEGAPTRRITRGYMD